MDSLKVRAIIDKIVAKWKHSRQTRVYLAVAMTGRKRIDMYNESLTASNVLEAHNIRAVSPVLEEGITPTHEILTANHDKVFEMQWRRDKMFIRWSHVLLDLTGPLKSEGVAHEIGYARFYLFKPVIRIYPNLGGSVARFEDDAIVESVEEAAKIIEERWGTWTKRFVWRIKILRKIPRFIWNQIREIVH